jgi:hypothetical protein
MAVRRFAEAYQAAGANPSRPSNDFSMSLH